MSPSPAARCARYLTEGCRCFGSWCARTGIINACVVAIVFNLAVFAFDVLSQSSTTLTMSGQYSARLAAPFYRHAFDDAETAADLITVVQATDDFLNYYDMELPLDYYNQIDLAYAMLEEGPDGPPLALFMDLVYQNDRGEMNVLEAFFTQDVPDMTLIGSDPLAAELFRQASPVLGAPAPGVLVADGMAQFVPGATRPDAIGAWHRHDTRSRIDAQAAMALFANDGPPLRYFLAPEGRLSAALKLMIWTCAVSPEAPDLDSCADPAGPPLSREDVRAAAAAATQRALMMECRAQLYETTEAHLRSCEAVRRTYLANLAWTPDPIDAQTPPKAGPWPWSPWASEDREDRIRRMASHMAGYSAARQEGTRHGVTLFGESECYRRAAAVLSDRASVERRADVAGICAREAEGLKARSEGPTMYVMWGSPSQNVDTSTATDGYDRCAAYQHDETMVARLAAFRSTIADLLSPSAEDRYLDPCSYHRQRNMLEVYGGDGPQPPPGNRVVIFSLNAQGHEDMHPMRGLTDAPGAWAHGMALDNLLTLGASYRPASFDPSGAATHSLAGAILAQLLGRRDDP